MINKITINEIEEEFDENKHQIYEIDNRLYLIDKDEGSIYHIDFEKIDDGIIETSDNDITNQEDSEDRDKTKDTHSKDEGTEKEEDEEAEEDEEDKENPEEDKEKKQSDTIDVSDPNLTKIKNAIKNKILKKSGCDMDFEMKETFETKPDGAESMKERRITQCMEESGKSRKACTEEVRKKMHEKGAEAVNPEDMKEKDIKKEEIVEETKKETEKEETKDTVEICSEEYDFLKEQVEELKTLKAEKAKTENTLESLKADFLVYKKKIDDKEATEKEAKRQEIIKRISHDFDIPEEKLNEKTMAQLIDNEEILELGLKRDTEAEEIETFGDEEDFKEIGDKIHSRYFLEI